VAEVLTTNRPPQRSNVTTWAAMIAASVLMLAIAFAFLWSYEFAQVKMIPSCSAGGTKADGHIAMPVFGPTFEYELRPGQ
jgi:hypothetical protein